MKISKGCSESILRKYKGVYEAKASEYEFVNNLRCVAWKGLGNEIGASEDVSKYKPVIEFLGLLY